MHWETAPLVGFSETANPRNRDRGSAWIDPIVKSTVKEIARNLADQKVMGKTQLDLTDFVQPLDLVVLKTEIKAATVLPELIKSAGSDDGQKTRTGEKGLIP